MKRTIIQFPVYSKKMVIHSFFIEVFFDKVYYIITLRKQTKTLNTIKKEVKKMDLFEAILRIFR